jgi:N6-adenosine-specific RNA methylase IME4
MLPDINVGGVLADPAWTFRTRSDKGRGRSPDGMGHYATMSLDEIKQMPVSDICLPDCALFLWATYPNLFDAREVLEAWGFRYSTVAFTWAKSGKSNNWPIGLGYWTRANPEICLLGLRGSPRRVARDVPNLIVAPRQEHSRKPIEIRDRIDRLLGPDIPKIELFARPPMPRPAQRGAWKFWGDGIGAC